MRTKVCNSIILFFYIANSYPDRTGLEDFYLSNWHIRDLS